VIDHLLGKPPRDTLDETYAARTTYGIGADIPEPQWRRVIEQLLFDGVLSEGEDSLRPILAIGDEEAMRAIFRKELPVRMREAQAKKGRRTPEERRAERAGRRGDAAELDDEQNDLFERLREWRLSVAKQEGVPPYVIFSNATLTAIAKANPTTLRDLGGVSGIGEKKLARYGETVLNILKLDA
jgi:ATP-dependent DNA helicase RecQ